MSFDLSLIADSVPKIARGAGLTLQLLFISLFIGTLLGVGAVLMRISGSRALAWPSFAYSYVFRGTPMLV